MPLLYFEKVWWGFLGSLLIHLGVAGWFWLSPRPRDVERVEIEFKESVKASAGTSSRQGVRRKVKKSRRSSKRSSKASHINPSWKNLKPGGDFGLAALETHPQPFTSDTGDRNKSENAWGSSGGGFAYVEHTLSFTQLIEEVNGLLNYPYPLASRGFSGTINSRLHFKDSRCVWSKTRVEGAQPYLRVYILALLKKLCGLEKISRMRFPDGLTVDMSFAFILTDNPEGVVTPESLGSITGNVLMFTRIFPARNLEYQLGPIRGVWFAPVISLDWPWVVEHWEQWVEGKDPLADFK